MAATEQVFTGPTFRRQTRAALRYQDAKYLVKKCAIDFVNSHKGDIFAEWLLCRLGAAARACRFVLCRAHRERDVTLSVSD